MSQKKKPPTGPFAELEKLREKIVDPGPKPDPKRTASAPAKPAKPEPVDPKEEEVSFYRLMSGVTPLDGAGKRVAVTEPTVANPARSHAARVEAFARDEDTAMDHLRGLVAGGSKFEVSDDGANVEGRRHDARPDLVRKLRRGQFPIDARLDLHGLTAPEAKTALVKFLSQSRTRKEKCVLVICGKGTHSADGGGILRGEMAAWLSQGPASQAVAAFSSAQREDGGSGAMYVLLLP